MRKGILFVLSGPSGAGKGTVLAHVFRMVDGLGYSVSATTRLPRIGEIEGVNYFFKTNEEFDRMATSGEFLEYVYKFGNGYGTIHANVDAMLEKGIDVVLEIEVIGATNIKKVAPDAVSIFVTPSRLSEIERRLIVRGSETEKNRLARVEVGKEEVKHIVDYDYIAINDDLDTCIETVVSIIRAERAKRIHNNAIVNNFLKGMEDMSYDD